MLKIRKIAAIGFGIVSSLYIYGFVVSLYQELAGYDLTLDYADGYTPQIGDMAPLFLAVTLGSLVGELIHNWSFEIKSEDSYTWRLVIVGNIIFFTFNLIKEMAFAPYVSSQFVVIASFVIDIFVIYGIWWALNQLMLQRKANKLTS